MKLIRDNKYIILSMVLYTIWILTVNTTPQSDFKYYYNVAKDLAEHGTLWSTYTAIGYSIILAGIFKIFGTSFLVAKVFNVFLSVISMIILSATLDRMKVAKGEKSLALILYAVFPPTFFFNSLLCTEIVFTTILFLITYIYLGNSKFKYLAIGLLVGINDVIKPFFIAFFLLIFIVDFVNERNLLKALKNSAIVLIVTLVTISPILYINYKIIGEFTNVSNNSGIVLYINNNSQNTHGGWMDANDIENSLVKTKEYLAANYTVRNKMLTKAAVKWSVENPDKFIVLGFKRLYNTYLMYFDVEFAILDTNINPTAAKLLRDYYNRFKWLVTIFGISMMLFTIFKYIRKFNSKELNKMDSAHVYMFVLFLMFAGVVFITEGQPRYSFPINFVLIYFLSKGIITAVDFSKRKLTAMKANVA